jgi:hypothetical protein
MMPFSPLILRHIADAPIRLPLMLLIDAYCGAADGAPLFRWRRCSMPLFALAHAR